MVVRRKDTSRTKHSSKSMPSKSYLEDEEGAKLLVLADWLKNDVGDLFAQIKRLETTVECIENYVEEQTGLEPGKEISSDSESSDSDYEYEPCEAPTSSEKKIPKAKCVRIKSVNKKAKPRRNPARAYKVEMESERQAERVPEGSSKKEESETRSYASSSNNLPSDPEELTKVFEKKLEALENMESKMSSSADNDIISLNFRYRNAENKNIIFVIEISKDKQVSDLEEEVRKKLGPINRNDFLRQIYPEEKPMRTEDRIFSYFNEMPDDEDRIHIRILP
ncbi:hypothetical protein RhiirC2_821158 [Rhizophagus irregularis]|uniref:Uncharacterized protein n=1 Tax=Rhizophagus irregularis TaxID=588596 RepID=A0A2N1MCI8_9GLOM|nr:hypothetical protein RhiirC2_821158 [Rhizophagus irregularis]